MPGGLSSSKDEDMQKAQAAKDKYFKFFLIDFLEFNMRKVASDNTIYCAQKCKMFDNLDTQHNSNNEEKQEFSCFEKCLGKFSDSYESALNVFGEHLKTMKRQNVYQHSDPEQMEKRFLMGEGTPEPVYDTPQGNKRRRQ